MGREYGDIKAREINNTVLLQYFIQDLRASSDPDQGLRLSAKDADFMNRLKAFNYEHIYRHPRLEHYKKYVALVLETLFVELRAELDQGGVDAIAARATQRPVLFPVFLDWLLKYSRQGRQQDNAGKYANRVLYDLDQDTDRFQAVLDFISGMTDNYALRCFDELVRF
jgi:dGTPase